MKLINHMEDKYTARNGVEISIEEARQDIFQLCIALQAQFDLVCALERKCNQIDLSKHPTKHVTAKEKAGLQEELHYWLKSKIRPHIDVLLSKYILSHQIQDISLALQNTFKQNIYAQVVTYLESSRAKHKEVQHL